MKNTLQVVTVKTLPELIDRTEEVARQVEARIMALNLDELDITDDNVKSITDLRATLSKELKEFEAARIQVKKQILAPYNQFEEVYTDRIKKLYEREMAKLDNETKKIYQARKDKEVATARDYYNELAKAYNIAEANFESVVVNYSSGKQMKLSIEKYFEDLKGALIMIDAHPHKERLYTLWEQYGRNLNAAAAALTDQLAMEERRAKELEAKVSVEPEPDLILPPVVEEVYDIEEVVEEDEVLTFNLKVSCSEEELRALVEYLFVNDIEYEIE